MIDLLLMVLAIAAASFGVGFFFGSDHGYAKRQEDEIRERFDINTRYIEPEDKL